MDSLLILNAIHTILLAQILFFLSTESCKKNLILDFTMSLEINYLSHKGVISLTGKKTLLTSTIPWSSKTVFVKQNISSLLPPSIVNMHLPFLLHTFPHLFARKTKYFKGFRSSDFFLFSLSFPAKQYAYKNFFLSGYKERIAFSFTLKFGNFYENRFDSKDFCSLFIF